MTLAQQIAALRVGMRVYVKPEPCAGPATDWRRGTVWRVGTVCAIDARARTVDVQFEWQPLVLTVHLGMVAEADLPVLVEVEAR